MKQKFFTSTIQSRFIKSLLHDTWLPIYKTISRGDYIIEGCLYIFRKTLVKCDKSGIYGDGAKIHAITHYNFGEKYQQYSEKFQSPYHYYDSKTHEWLGRYLRCYRDIYEINLMPFYNCFSGNYLSNAVIREDGIVSTITKDYKIAQIPINFNTKYTIAIDCPSNVFIAPAVLNNGNFISVTIDANDINLTNRLCENNIVRKNNLSFKQPFIYEIENKNPKTEQFYQRYENKLYMLIQLPLDNNSSIVVLEGDYIGQHYDTEKIINIESLGNLSNKEINELFISKLSLLQMSDNTSYPFADRLIEYLLWNTITPLDTVGENIDRTQEMIQNYAVQDEFIQGVWDNYLRYTIYRFYDKDKKSKHLDINGFVDKDVEKFLLRGVV